MSKGKSKTSSKSKYKKATPKKTFKQKLSGWFANEAISNHQDDIIKFLADPNKNFNDLKYKGGSVIYWSASLDDEDILAAALARPEAANFINAIHSTNAIPLPNVTNRTRNSTALSVSAYFGFHNITSLLLDKNASIEVIDASGDPINAYQELGNGYWVWPTDAADYKKTFEKLMEKDPADPDRQFFSDKYTATNDKAYLACLFFYDQVESGMEDRNNQLYRPRDILIVEDTASRRFFRFADDMREGGIAKALADSLFSGQTVPLDGYPARSVIIALVDKMQRTNQVNVQAAIDLPTLADPHKRIFSVKFTLGTTQVLYEWLPQKWQRGNCILMINGQKPEPFGALIAIYLKKLTNSNSDGKINKRTKQLGKLFLEKTRQLQPFRHYEFTYNSDAQNKLVIRIDQDNKQHKAVATLGQAQAMIHKLNGLLILWSIAEPARRLSGHQAPNAAQDKRGAVDIDHIPVATMQIRALQLLAEGQIAIDDIFGKSDKYADNPDHNAEYGVSTGKNLVDDNNFYAAKEKAKQLSNIGLPCSVLASKASWFSRNYTKQILCDGYGYGNESDDEDYSDEDLPANPFILTP